MESKFLKVLAFTSLLLMFSGCGIWNQYDYNDNKLIASENSHHNIKNSSVSPLKNGKVNGKIGELNGAYEILTANVSKDTENTLQIKLTASSGKGKLVLVKPNSKVEVLAEAIKEENNYFEDNVTVKCISGINKIKIVGENYGGTFEIYQPNRILFDNISKSDSKMFSENFPFEKEDN